MNICITENLNLLINQGTNIQLYIIDGFIASTTIIFVGYGDRYVVSFSEAESN